jgi:hypothetical protein
MWNKRSTKFKDIESGGSPGLYMLELSVWLSPKMMGYHLASGSFK